MKLRRWITGLRRFGERSVLTFKRLFETSGTDQYVPQCHTREEQYQHVQRHLNPLCSLSASANLRQEISSFIMSVRPSGPMEELGSH
jgi:hypothetical protein